MRGIVNYQIKARWVVDIEDERRVRYSLNNAINLSKENSLFLSVCCLFLITFFVWPTPLALTLHNSIVYLCV